MTAHPSSLSSPTPALTDTATLSAALECLEDAVPLEMTGDYRPQTVYEILLHAASRCHSLEQTSKLLEGAPSSNTLRYHLDKLNDIELLEAQLNQALQSKLPGRLKKHKHPIAIDLNLIPYYGKASALEGPYLYRSQAKAGTTSFFAYATVYVIHRHKRVTLALHAVPRHETLVATLTYLLAQVATLKVRVKQLYLDRGFYSVPVIRWLQALDIPFLMPAIVRGKQGGTRQLLKGRCSYVTEYTLTSSLYGTVTCEIRVICSYHKGRRQKHGVQYLLYVAHRVKTPLRGTHHRYRYRFGIESSYRLKNQCRIRTTTKNPVIRLLFVGIAFVLVNLWIYLLWQFISVTRRGSRQIFRQMFSLNTLLEFVTHAVERHFPMIQAIFLPTEP